MDNDLEEDFFNECLENTNNLSETKEYLPEVTINNDFFKIVEKPGINNLLYKTIYQTNNDNDLDKNKDYYSNHLFCKFCSEYKVLPENEISNFIDYHINVLNNNKSIIFKKKILKYLTLVFRVCPNLFQFDNIIYCDYLRKLFFNLIGTNEKDYISLNDMYLNNELYYKYIAITKKKMTPFVYEIYFYQPDLKYESYTKCTICKGYMCPIHFYLSNSYCSKCTYCEQYWTVCGWCKDFFNEEYACKYIHQNNLKISLFIL